MKAVKTLKPNQYALLLFFSIFILYTAEAQTIPMPKDVKFKIGDNMDWANKSFNDHDWENIQLGTSLKETEIKDNIYVWYRIKLVIPSSLKSAARGYGIKLNLGKIDDVDQTFLNGKLIGQTGSMPPQFVSQWEAGRVYVIADKDVNWDNENVIAVRVYSNVGGAGMYDGPYTYAPIQWSDFITVQHSIIETANNGFTTKIEFVNQKNIAFSGTVKYRIADKNNKELYTDTKPIQVLPEQGSKNSVTFQDYHPVNEQIFKVGYEITENNGSATVKMMRFI